MKNNSATANGCKNKWCSSSRILCVGGKDVNNLIKKMTNMLN